MREAYRIDQIRADHGASAAFASLAMHYCNILSVLAKPITNFLAEVGDKIQWWRLQENALDIFGMYYKTSSVVWPSP